jgi:hypothetical protein
MVAGPAWARPVVLAFVRPPVLGAVKRRLAATEGAREALRVYRLLAEGVVRALLAARERGACSVALCVADADDDSPAARDAAAWLPGADAVFGQGPGDLGARMDRALTRALAAGAPAAAVVGSDVVGVTPEILAAAFAALERSDAVIAPTPDGGYGLVALKRPQPGLFRGVPWGSPVVAAATRARAREAGLALAEVNGLRDVDVAADLDGVVPLVSVLVPVLDEMPRLPERLAALRAQAAEHPREVEVLVANGGSTDGSREAVLALGLPLLDAPRGRGTQLRAAAALARGRWLWTLHADATLAPGTLSRVLAFARRGTHPWAFVRTRIGSGSLPYAVLSALTEIRARWFGLPYGDQGLLVRRSLHDAVGGYAPVPLMEDVLLSRRLAARHRPALLGGTLHVDDRRWRRHGLLGTTHRNLSTLARFLFLHQDPAHLAPTYDRGHRPHHLPPPAPPHGTA